MPGVDAVVELSLVIPLFNEEEVFPELIRRLRGVLDTLPFEAEVVLVDDGSRDGTPDLVGRQCREDSRFKGIVLSRNFGHQLALTAGLQHASGNAVAVLDGDLQDPPEVLLDFYHKLKEGYDVVYAVRQKRKEHLFKRAAYAGFYRLLRRLSTIPIPLDSGDFCMMTGRVVRLMNSFPERRRFVRGLRSWIGFRQVGVPYERDARNLGHSKYTLRKLMALALDGIFTFSEKPLRWASYTGGVVSFLSFAWAVRTVIWRLFTDENLPGFATVAAGMFFLGGVQLLSIGILGEYIGRIHNEVKGRPLYIVDRLFGLTASCGTQPRDFASTDSATEDSARTRTGYDLNSQGPPQENGHYCPANVGAPPTSFQ